MFSINDIVWAKSSVARQIFWPAKVTEPENDLHIKRKKSIVAYVHFLVEDTYEVIAKDANIQPFNCARKSDFVKKGRSLKMQEKRFQFECALKRAKEYITLHAKQKKKAKSLPNNKINSPQTKGVDFGLRGKETKSDSSSGESSEASCGKNEVKSYKDGKICSDIKQQQDKQKTSSECLANATKKTTRSNALVGASSISKTTVNGKTKSTKINDKLKKGYASCPEAHSSNTGTKMTRRSCSTAESSACNARKKIRRDFDMYSEKDSLSRTAQKTRFESDIKIRRRLWNGKTKSAVGTSNNNSQERTKKILVKSCELEQLLQKERTALCPAKNNNRKAKSECTPKKNESTEKNEANITPRQKRLNKRNRFQMENTETVQEGTCIGGFNKGRKRARLGICEEANQITNKTKESLKTVDSWLDSLNGVACGSTSKQRSLINLDPEIVLTRDCGINGMVSEQGRENVEVDENKFKNLVEKEDYTLTEEEKEIEGNVKDYCSSSDDDSLPEAFSPLSGPKKSFSPGDVVWVKYKKFPFWPAQVARQHRKLKNYYYVKFLPKTACRCIRVCVKNIKITEDHETFQRYRSQEIDPSCRKEFEEAVKQAEDILMRRVLPKDDSFLDEIEEPTSELSDDDEAPSSGNLEQERAAVDDEECKHVENVQHDESGFDSSDDESERKREEMSPYSSILNELHLCKERLLDIYREKVVSSRHQTFNYGTVTDKNNLRRSSSFCPIQDKKTMENIILQLKTWYDAETRKKSITFDYVHDVWLPEAMIYYIQITDKISAVDAENVYFELAKNVNKRDTKELSDLFKKRTIDQATMQETVKKAKQKLNYERKSS